MPPRHAPPPHCRPSPPSLASPRCRLNYLAAIAAALAVVIGWVYSRAGAFEAEIALYMRVRAHFVEANGLKWSAGLKYPDGFRLNPKRFWFF